MVAAKTGTAQTNYNTKANALFVGYGQFTPLKMVFLTGLQPQIAVLILVENAREGSLNAVPIAKDIFKWYYDNRIKK